MSIGNCSENKTFFDILKSNPNKYRNYIQKNFEIGHYIYVLNYVPKLDYEYVRSNFFASDSLIETQNPFYRVKYELPKNEIYAYKDFTSFHIKTNHRGTFIVSQNPIDDLPF